MRYTRTAIALHWLIAILVIGQIALGWWMQEIPKQPVGPRVNAFNLHKSIGLTADADGGAACLARDACAPAAGCDAGLAGARRTAESLAALRVPVRAAAVGLSGSVFSGYPVRYFGLVLPAWAEKNVALKDLLADVHAITSWILVGAIALHVAAALKHHFIDRDGLLSAWDGGARADPDRRRAAIVF